MLKYSVRLLENPTATQIDECLSICLRAFKDDDSLASLVSGDMSLLGPLFRAMLCATAVGGEFYLAIDDMEKILGLGLWFGPGEGMFATEKQRKAGFDDFYGRLSPEAQKWWMRTYRVKMGEFLSHHLGPEGTLNSYILSVLATDPPFQRKGIATKIIDTVFQQAIVEDNRLALITTTEKNVIIHESMGWRNEAHFSLEAPTGPVTCTLLTKNAQDKYDIVSDYCRRNVHENIFY